LSLREGELRHPHWKGEKARGSPYESTKALGVLWNYMEEKIKSIHQEKENRSSNAYNPHIILHVQNMEAKGLHAELKKLRETMRNALLSYNTAMYQKKTEMEESGKSQEMIDSELFAWLKKTHIYWRQQLISWREGEDSKMRAAAVLYEQTRICAVEKSAWKSDIKAYRFPFQIAQDYLTRMVGDGQQKELGLHGVSATVTRGNEFALCGRKKS